MKYIRGTEQEIAAYQKIVNEKLEKERILQEAIKDIKNERNRFINSSWRIRTVNIFRIGFPLVIIIFFPLFWVVYVNAKFEQGFITAILLAGFISVIALDWHKKAVQKVLSEWSNTFECWDKKEKTLNDQLIVVKESFLEAAEKICIKWSTYPPDWNERRKRVFMRDGNKCVKCSWPEGAKRRSRELHVHHIRPLSQKGDHSLENLITLCHLCHRKVDIMHSGVVKMKKNKRK